MLLVFCPNPGPLLHGRIYVVLKDDRISPLPIRSEFRSYIPNVSHGRTIEFDCDLGKIMIINVAFSAFRKKGTSNYRIRSSWTKWINM